VVSAADPLRSLISVFKIGAANFSVLKKQSENDILKNQATGMMN
jgi:hypothetical protein